MQMWKSSPFNWSSKPQPRLRKCGPWITYGDLRLEKLLEEEKLAGEIVKGSKGKEKYL